MNSVLQPSFLVRNAGIFVLTVFAVAHAAGVIINFSKIDFLALLLSGVIFVLRIIYLNRFKDFSLNAARPILWISWDISMIVMPVLLFNIYSDSIYPNAQLVITPKDINFSILIGVMVLTIHFFASYFYKNDKYSNTDYYPSISEMMFWILAVMGATLWFCALVAAKYFGTGTLSMEGNLLPYKMSGVINFFAYYFPSFYVLFLLDGVLKFKRNIFLALIPILCLSALTAYVSLSKAAVIAPMVMIGLYIVLSRRMTFGVAIMGGILLFLAFLSGSYISSFRESLHTIRYKTWNEMTADYGALDYLHRVFRDGTLFQKFHAYSDTVDLSQELESYGNNPSDLHTYGIDKTPLNSMHSSGCSTLVSVYCFGLQYVPVAVVIMSLVTLFIDYGLPRSKWIFSSLLFRTYITFYVCLMMFNLSMVQFLSPIFFGSGNVITGVLIPLAILFAYVIYIAFFCRKRVDETLG
ncbi:unknown [Coraliomargarita sp. CAG:312]|nr:unknown [Coraliomargarita sp. CAG:312]